MSRFKLDKLLGGALISLLAVSLAQATPFVPEKDDFVLERVTTSQEIRSLQPLRTRLAAVPNDLTAATELARGYLQLARDNGDPRFISYAEATLAPWMAQASPPSQVLILQAAALQSLHRFSTALELLERTLAIEPRNTQAWLAKATVLQVLGRFDEARKACARVLAGDQFVGMACVSSVNALNGRLSSSYRLLLTTAPSEAHLPPDLGAWLATLKGEMAARMGDERAAEEHLRHALELAPRDLYAKTALADLWIETGRYLDVINLLRDHEQQDNLLLRLAIAAKRAHVRDAERWARLLEERYEAARRIDDRTHLREQAMFALHVAGNPRRALALARENWQIQKEPADLRIYLESARAAKSGRDLTIVLEWLERTRYEDHAAALLCSRFSPTHPLPRFAREGMGPQSSFSLPCEAGEGRVGVIGAGAT